MPCDPTVHSPTLRAFVALTPGPRGQTVVADACARLRERLRGHAGVALVDPAAAHLTLAFLGALPRDDLAAVIARVGTVAAATPAFAWSLAGFGAFPGGSRPRVVWLGVDVGNDAVVALAGRVGRALAPWLGEGAPFRPHVTLARIRRATPALARELAAALHDLPEPDAPAEPVSEVAVVLSHLGGPRARHEVAARLPLR